MVESGVATVMFTDLVGSTRMRDELGDDVADAIGASHDAIISDAVGATRGRLVKTLGDGALIVFDSSVDAVTAAQRIQEGVATYNDAVQEDRQISVRIGINAGEVVHDDGDLVGLPVAVASRVCGAASGGQILVTSVVRSLIGRRAEFPFHSIGSHTLKGISEPVELWSLSEAIAHEAHAAVHDVPFPPFLARSTPRNLVGRDSQMEALDDAHAAANDGARLLAVIGEPGIGKTALTATWCRKAADDGAMVVAGRCTPDAALPYQPFIEIARSVLAVRPSLLPTLGPGAGNVAQLIPGIDAPGSLPPPVQTDPDTTQYLMAEAFAALLRPMNGDATVALLDDLHWADQHSVAVLAHLARYPAELPLLIIGTYRDTDLVRSHPLPLLLTDLRRERRLDRVPLLRLSESDVREMISGHFGADAPDDVIASISEETQGNPFFIEEITMHLEDEGAIDPQGQWVSDIPIEDYGIPEGVREVVGRRLDRLGENANAMLEVGAVIGPIFSIEIAGEIAGLDDVDVDAIIERAMNAGVVAEGDDEDELAFSHALVRQTLYDDLPIRRRVRLHRQVAEALEQRHEPSGVVLHHWLNANDPDRALAAALGAAQESDDASAIADMIAHLELALDLWDDADDPETASGTTHPELVVRLTEDYYGLGDPQARALGLLTKELESAEGYDDRIQGLLVLAYGQHLWYAGSHAEGKDAYRKALDLLEAYPQSVEYARAVARYAARLVTSGRDQDGISEGERALDLSRSLGDVDAESKALSALASAHGNLGHLDESSSYFDELRELSRGTGQLRSILLAYMNQGDVYRINGEHDAALELFDAGVRVAEEYGLDKWRDALLSNAAEVLLETGRWNEAAALIELTTEFDGLDQVELIKLTDVIMLAAERGDDSAFDIVLERLEEIDILDLDPQLGGPYLTAQVSRARWQSRFADGFNIASTALAATDDLAQWREFMQLTAASLELVADAAESNVAEDRWIEEAVGWHARFLRDNVLAGFAEAFEATATADLARAQGGNDPGLWRMAVSKWDDETYGGAKARWRLAEALLAADPLNAEIPTLLADAEATAATLGAKPLLEAVRRAQARIGE